MSEFTCGVCFHHCRLRDGQTGLCRARKNEGGANVCVNYGKVTALALDPIEKKPLAMFCPGTYILSVGSFGCNLRCPFCQNDSISCADNASADWQSIAPEELAKTAERLRDHGNIGMAFTYNEPMIGWEFVEDTAKLIRARGMKNVVVTNGSVSLSVLERVLPYIDAFNIDLKGFTESWYGKLGGNLQTVLDFIRAAAAASHVELTVLVVPGENDSEEEMRRIAEWISSVDLNIPLHITRFFPKHLMNDRPATDIVCLRRLYDTAKKALPNVFLGNV